MGLILYLLITVPFCYVMFFVFMLAAKYVAESGRFSGAAVGFIVTTFVVIIFAVTTFVVKFIHWLVL